MNNYKITEKLTHEELAERFIKLNTEVKVLNWQPLLNDDSKVYADPNQPTIKVQLENNWWLRVYVDKDTNEITWY